MTCATSEGGATDSDDGAKEGRLTPSFARGTLEWLTLACCAHTHCRARRAGGARRRTHAHIGEPTRALYVMLYLVVILLVNMLWNTQKRPSVPTCSVNASLRHPPWLTATRHFFALPIPDEGKLAAGIGALIARRFLRRAVCPSLLRQACVAQRREAGSACQHADATACRCSAWRHAATSRRGAAGARCSAPALARASASRACSQASGRRSATR